MAAAPSPATAHLWSFCWWRFTHTHTPHAGPSHNLQLLASRLTLLLLSHPCCCPPGVLFYFFKPAGAGSCSLNVTLITLSLLLCCAFSGVSLLPLAKRGSLFPSATTSLYVMYLAYSALQSEPRDYECNGLGHRLNAASGSTLVVGMLVTLLSVVYSALRAGEVARVGDAGWGAWVYGCSSTVSRVGAWCHAQAVWLLDMYYHLRCHGGLQVGSCQCILTVA